MNKKELKELKRFNRSYLVWFLTEKRLIKQMNRGQRTYGETMDLIRQNQEDYETKLRLAGESLYCVQCDRPLVKCLCK